jgi:hypothetical protein
MLALIAPQAQRGARREASLREKFFLPNKTHQVECFALDLRHALTQASPHALTAQNRCCSSSENQSCAPWFQPPTQLKVATRVHTYTCSAKSAPHPASHPLQRRQPPAALSALQRQKVQTCGFRPKAPPPDQSRVWITAARGQSRDPRCCPTKNAAPHNPSGERKVRLGPGHRDPAAAPPGRVRCSRVPHGLVPAGLEGRVVHRSAAPLERGPTDVFALATRNGQKYP